MSRSVERAVKVLEIFEQYRRPMPATEIGDLLGGPRSSVAALLRTLVDLSILAHDRRTTNYFPTARFGRLAGWLSDSFIPSVAALDLLGKIQDQIDETCLIAAPVEEVMEFVHVVRGSRSISYWTEPGRRIAMIGSAIGAAYLMTVSRSTLQSLHRRAMRLERMAVPDLTLQALQAQVSAARERGCSVGYSLVDPDVGAICVPLPPHVGPKQLVLSVTGPVERIRSREAEITALIERELPLLYEGAENAPMPLRPRSRFAS